jgi:hypothetical protein
VTLLAAMVAGIDFGEKIRKTAWARSGQQSPMTDETRGTRLIAVMGGNGYIFGRSFDLIWGKDIMSRGMLTVVFVYSFLSLIGVGCCYISLRRPAGDKLGRTAEWIAISVLLFAMLGWLQGLALKIVHPGHIP